MTLEKEKFLLIVPFNDNEVNLQFIYDEVKLSFFQ